MSLVNSLRTWLSANVSELSGISVFRQRSPQSSTVPRVVITRDGEDPNNDLGGAVGTKSAEITIECHHTTPDKSETLARAIIEDLEPYTGTMGDVTCKAVILNDNSDEAEPNQSGGDAKHYVTFIDLTIHYE